MDIFWSPSFYTITLTRFISWFSLPATHSMQFQRIRSVRLTILGLVSFSILRSVGKTAFIEDSNSGLFLLTCILKRRSSIASVLSLSVPSPVKKEKSLAPCTYFSFFSSALIDFLIFYSRRWLTVFFKVSFLYYISYGSSSGGILYGFCLGSYFSTLEESRRAARSRGVIKNASVGILSVIYSMKFFSFLMQSLLRLPTMSFIPYILQILSTHCDAALDTNRFSASILFTNVSISLKERGSVQSKCLSSKIRIDWKLLIDFCCTSQLSERKPQFKQISARVENCGYILSALSSTVCAALRRDVLV